MSEIAFNKLRVANLQQTQERKIEGKQNGGGVGWGVSSAFSHTFFIVYPQMFPLLDRKSKFI